MTWSRKPFRLSLGLSAGLRQPHQWMHTSGVWARYLWSQDTSRNHLSYGVGVSCVHHRSIMKDGSFSDMVPGAKRFPKLLYFLDKLYVGSSQSACIVTGACRPSGYESHQPSRTSPSFMIDRWYIRETMSLLLKWFRKLTWLQRYRAQTPLVLIHWCGCLMPADEI